ncbi:MAG: hypothetical protein LBC82_09770, partial [Oscillospiraceae bacterium]|nr:hypothetical protein [Oscillospiraceae bacterium]
FRSGLAGEMKNSELFSPPFRHSSHGKRVVAPQQCYVYPAYIALTFFESETFSSLTASAKSVREMYQKCDSFVRKLSVKYFQN